MYGDDRRDEPMDDRYLEEAMAMARAAARKARATPKWPPPRAWMPTWWRIYSTMLPLAAAVNKKDDVKVGSPHTNSIEEDLPILAEVGFVIDYTPDAELGEGMYGVTYRGWYGRQARYLTSDTSAVRFGKPFAVKIIDFKRKLSSSPGASPLSAPTMGATGSELREVKEATETEKFIITQIEHPNVLSARYIFNMGEPRIHTFKGEPDAQYISHDRVYIIMDYADGGALNYWLRKYRNQMSAFTRIRFVRELFAGMMHLHELNIVHGDVHTGNILVFHYYGRAIPKWADYGQGFVSEAGKQYLYKQPVPQSTWIERATQDISDMGENIFLESILSHRQKGKPESESEKITLDELTKMCVHIRGKRPQNIAELYEDFRQLLENPSPIDDIDID